MVRDKMNSKGLQSVEGGDSGSMLEAHGISIVLLRRVIRYGTIWLLALLVSQAAFAATYYVCAATGAPCNAADSNNGTSKTTTWLHAPGMSTATGLAASTTINAGDSIIFRGGDTWHFDATAPAVGTFTITVSGSAGNPVTYGVDQTWFAGGSWTRPILSGDNATSTTFVASCTHANTGTLMSIGSGSSSFVTFDNFEITGVCWNTNSSIDGTMMSIPGGETNIIVSNLYCHGWTMTSGASDNFPCISTFGGGMVADNNQFTFDVFDGSDSPHYAAGSPIGGSGSSPACQWSSIGNAAITNVSETSGSVVTITTPSDLSAFGGGGVVQMNGLTTATWLNGLPAILASSVTATTVVFTDPTSHGTLASHAEVGVIGFGACASGQGINGSHAYNVDHSIFRYLSNFVVTANCHSYHDNLFEFLYGTFSSGTNQQHPNVMNCIGGASSESLYWYNNVMRHTFVTEDVYFAVRTNLYYFNNVIYDNMNSVFGPKSLATACTRFNTVANSTLPVNGFIYNNTDGDNSCLVKFEVANAPLTQWSGTGTFENNNYGAQGANCAGTCGTPLTGEYTCSTGGTCTVVNNGTHVFQTTATQTSQGYTSGNMYQPTLGGSTISAGTNASASCATFSPDSALCSGSSAGVKEQAGSGGQVAISPAVPVVARGSVFDAGAFQFNGSASSSTCSPGSGSYSSTQHPACTNPNSGTTVQCYTINGTSPATNGLGTACTTGTLLTSGATITVAATVTINIIAGTSTLSDSSINSYTYTIVTQASPATCSPTSGVVPQTVTCTNPNAGTTVACYSLTTTPVTNTLGTGCSTGTQYTTPLSISVASTLKIIAGTSTQTDSNVNTYIYTAPGATVTGPAPGMFAMNIPPHRDFNGPAKFSPVQ